MFGSLGWQEFLLIGFIVVLVFGARRLPDMARGLGQSIREFRKELKEIRNISEEFKP